MHSKSKVEIFNKGHFKKKIKISFKVFEIFSPLLIFSLDKNNK